MVDSDLDLDFMFVVCFVVVVLGGGTDGRGKLAEPPADEEGGLTNI